MRSNGHALQQSSMNPSQSTSDSDNGNDISQLYENNEEWKTAGHELTTDGNYNDNSMQNENEGVVIENSTHLHQVASYGL